MPEVREFIKDTRPKTNTLRKVSAVFVREHPRQACTTPKMNQHGTRREQTAKGICARGLRLAGYMGVRYQLSLSILIRARMTVPYSTTICKLQANCGKQTHHTCTHTDTSSVSPPHELLPHLASAASSCICRMDCSSWRSIVCECTCSAARPPPSPADG